MKKKTPNAERPTPNIELASCRIAERSNGEYVPTSKRVYNLENRLLEFAAVIIELTESLPNTRVGNHVAGQLLRCGTSSLSNHGEVEAAESRRDFLHKLRICLKELRETKRWLRNPNFCSQHSEGREERQMIRVASELEVGRWTLSVRRFLL